MSTFPTPVLPYDTPRPRPQFSATRELSYAQTDAQLAGQSLVLMRQLLALAVLCGPAVGTCFLVLARWELGPLIHASVYAALLTTAVFAGLRTDRIAVVCPPLRSPTRSVLDLLALVGLTIIGFGPIVAQVASVSPYGRPPLWATGVTSLAFLLLLAGTYRHLLLYRALAELMDGIGLPRRARSLRRLGMAKFVIETPWLACCTLSLLATPGGPLNGILQSVRGAEGLVVFPLLGALLGVPVFGVLWLVMISVHARCVAYVRHAATLGVLTPDAPADARVGFDVLDVRPG